MSFDELAELLTKKFGDAILQQDKNGLQPSLIVKPSSLIEICQFLRDTEGLYFDMLTCITGIDNFPQPTLEVVYHLYSIPYNHWAILRVFIERKENPQEQEKIPSLTSLWGGANWLERETAEMFGIIFDGHPDLRRLLLPDDWEGFPLRKNYKHQEKYHGITVKY
ncbi:MAG: NADH-quinone oxidoreductase subunit C [Cytophagales bacterium]|nr:NADH-quinone oxidoreductase subunit C [Cytophagales bacterium]MDW8384901.1 NADH-quinone oxidoreductase subunit C [Flammeovirgaceae bacterium]